MTGGRKPGADPVRLAQAHARQARPKRFFNKVELGEAPKGGMALLLDGRPARTPAKKPLVVPAGAFAEALRAEWAAQGETIDPLSMPATRLANSAIDGVAARMDVTRADILDYCGSDMILYRAGEPAGLVARQQAAWDPLLAWARERYGAAFILVQGVIHQDQPEAGLARIAGAIEEFDTPFRVAGLHSATTLTGSALIALAVADGFLNADAAWAAAHVDEDWNIAQWGRDAQAERRRAARRTEFDAAVLALCEMP